jgi:phosphopantetheinyl transferase (holo-ACP synthase)
MCTRRTGPFAAHYAERFALKEAIFKALALDDTSGASWRVCQFMEVGRQRRES